MTEISFIQYSKLNSGRLGQGFQFLLQVRDWRINACDLCLGFFLKRSGAFFFSGFFFCQDKK